MSLNKISIIGAGPVGLYLSNLLSKKFDVSVFEENKTIGLPQHCTGLISNEMKKLFDIKEITLNKIKGAEIIAPDGYSNIIKTNRVKASVINRINLEKELYYQALNNNVKVILRHRLINFKKEKDTFLLNFLNKRIKNNKRNVSNVLIGADGPVSNVAKTSGLLSNRKFLMGIQARVKLNNLDQQLVTLYLGKDVAPGFFAWVVPENEKTAKVGLATSKNAKYYFDKFIKKLNPIKKYNIFGGLIPLYNPRQVIEKDNVYLVGDAATQNKPTTGGGLIMGFHSAKILSYSLFNNKNYTKEFNNKLRKELYLTLKLRQLLNKFSDNDYNSLVRVMESKPIKEVLVNQGSMDFPSKFLLPLLAKKPSLLKYLFKLI